MTKSTISLMLLIGMYAGVVLFLYACTFDNRSRAALLLIGGAVFTVTCGLCRCYLVDGDCEHRSLPHKAP